MYMPRKRKGHQPGILASSDILSRNMTHCRQVLKESQANFAARLGVTQRRVSQIEIGQANPTLRTLEPMAERLGVTISLLLHDFKDGTPLPGWTEAQQSQQQPRSGWIIEHGERRPMTASDA
jgi:transcriptional regulator with XRE-family HTH domain